MPIEDVERLLEPFVHMKTRVEAGRGSELDTTRSVRGIALDFEGDVRAAQRHRAPFPGTKQDRVFAAHVNLRYRALPVGTVTAMPREVNEMGSTPTPAALGFRFVAGSRALDLLCTSANRHR